MYYQEYQNTEKITDPWILESPSQEPFFDIRTFDLFYFENSWKYKILSHPPNVMHSSRPFYYSFELFPKSIAQLGATVKKVVRIRPPYPNSYACDLNIIFDFRNCDLTRINHLSIYFRTPLISAKHVSTDTSTTRIEVWVLKVTIWRKT